MRPQRNAELDLEMLISRLRSGLKVQMEVTRRLVAASRQLMESAAAAQQKNAEQLALAVPAVARSHRPS